ncbi:MAG: hypothetical protein IT384_23335 [Deltaproteobacteria bacterium]|nr:hypothetical protein [Deltaproteobacteria bacterium]
MPTPRLRPLTDIAFTLTATGAERRTADGRLTLTFPPSSAPLPTPVRAAVLDDPGGYALLLADQGATAPPLCLSIAPFAGETR